MQETEAKPERVRVTRERHECFDFADRTVASLEGKSDLVSVRRSMLPRDGIADTGKAMRTTDPNGRSIFLEFLSPARVVDAVPSELRSSIGCQKLLDRKTL